MNDLVNNAKQYNQQLEERFLELTEDILAVVEDRLTKLEHAVCVVAQAILWSWAQSSVKFEEKIKHILRDECTADYLEEKLRHLIADLTPEPKKSAIITPKPDTEPSEPDPKNGYGWSKRDCKVDPDTHDRFYDPEEEN